MNNESPDSLNKRAWENYATSSIENNHEEIENGLGLYGSSPGKRIKQDLDDSILDGKCSATSE